MKKPFEDRLLQGDTITVHPLTPEVIEAARNVILARATDPEVILQALGLDGDARELLGAGHV